MKLIMTKGFPASGKTTWARQQVEELRRSLGLTCLQVAEGDF